MRITTGFFQKRVPWLVTAIVVATTYSPANAAQTVIGTQYRVDQLFPEFNCYYSSGNYPTSCGNPQPGATVFVCVKNTGASSETITDAVLNGYSLKTVIKMSAANYNPDQLSSIYFTWDDPPDDLEFGAGEPVWWKADPPTVPVGGVTQVAIRLRKVPTTNNLTFGVVSTSGTITTNLIVDSSAPRITSIGYSEDRKKIYLHWRRSGGPSAAPSSIWLNGTNVTALTTTVGDPNYNFAASVISLPSGLPHFSYNVYQGVYGDGKTATAGQRAWTNKFIYCTWSTFEESGNYDGRDWLEEAAAHGFNNIECNLGAMGGVLGTVSGRNRCRELGYGYTILDTSKLQPTMDPDLWFINDEPDAEENNQGNTHCGTGTRIPCDTSKYAGTLVMKEAVGFAAELQNLRPNVPITVNLDGGLQPQSWYTWGPAVDVLESNNYYEARMRDAYFEYPNRIPLHNKPKVSYSTARSGTEGAGPNPFRHILYSTHGDDPYWPYPFPTSKHIEAYYSLAGGTKGFGYWWFNPPRGLFNSAEAPALWKEMGLIGNEVKTAKDLIVRSTPVDLILSTNSPWIWARGVASGIDTLVLYVVNDNFVNDINGCHITNVPNAALTVTLPVWMQSSPTAFEITRGGAPGDASWSLNGSQFQINLGTLQSVRMIVITTDASLRSAVQQRYDNNVKANVCSFAPELCVNYPPSISQQPSSQTVVPGGTANLTVVAGGTSPLGYGWQKNNSNLNNGGHYSGVLTSTLTITGADQNDAANYRCVVTNAYGTTNSASAFLTVTNAPNLPPSITQQPVNQTLSAGGTANFTVAATGSGTLYYQWQRNNSNLNNAGHYSGVTTEALTITSADAGDAGSYRCVVTNAYGSTNSAAATLAIDLNVCFPGDLLGHGNMEDATSYSVCPDWTSYSAGNGTATFNKEATIIHGGAAAQRCRNTAGAAGSLLGIRQTFDANIGDAFTFDGWVQPVSNPGAGQQVAMVAVWNGTTANPTTNGNSTWKVSTGARDVWTHLQNLTGNATSNSVTLFLDSRRTLSSQDLTAYWDDVVCYRAYVPPAPMVSEAASTSLNVDPLPGCNTNGAAQFAISIGGGAYTLGTHWVQTDGTVSTTPVWQSDAAWSLKTVTGLVSGTTYTFKVQARYSSALPQPTSLGSGTPLSPTATQPPQIAQQPSPQSVCPGDNAVFSVTATGNGLTYQWQTNGVNVTEGGHYGGATSPTLTVINAGTADAVNYRCVVNGSGSTNSASVALTLKAGTLITADPNDQTVPAGTNVTLSAAATGEGVLTYQWLANGVDLTNNGHYSGVTSPTLTISNVTSADSADYRCVVTGGCGSANSGPAFVTVITPGLCLGTLNPDFEDGFSVAGGGYIANNWFEWETDPGVVIGYEESSIIHTGGRAQRIRIWGGPGGSSGGVYQQVPAAVGQAYSVSVWTYSADNLTTCSLGVDPTGGTDGTGVTWSAGSTNTAWVQETVAGIANGFFITIYLKVTTTDDAKRNGYFDNLTPGSSSGALLLNAQMNGGSLTLTWPECPGAHLERTDGLNSPIGWVAVTNQVDIVNGQRTVTLAPTGNAGYYRLVLE